MLHFQIWRKGKGKNEEVKNSMKVLWKLEDSTLSLVPAKWEENSNEWLLNLLLCHSIAVKICLNFYLIEPPPVYFVSRVFLSREEKGLVKLSFIFTATLWRATKNNPSMLHSDLERL